VVVAVDGPDEHLEQVAQRAGAMTVVLPHNRGSYAARNAAIAALPEDIELVAFTDSDCIVDPFWLTGHRDALATCDLSGGAIDVTLRATPSPAEWVDKVRHLHQRRYVEEEGYAATANLAVRRAVLRSAVFDDSLRSSGDNEFCVRVRAMGFHLSYSPDARGEHPARRTDVAVMNKIRRICGGILANPANWEHRATPRPRPSRHMARLARDAGVAGGPWWQLHACLLQYRADRAIAQAVRRAKAQRGWL
jgi:glycosyltransferase involved in cell wall biosynthesis